MYFIPNCLQKFVNITYILPTLTDHSPTLILLSNDNSDKNGRSLWKSSTSLVYDEVFVENMKKLITKINTLNEFILNVSKQNGKFLKYKIRKFMIGYSKTAAKRRKQQMINLEPELKNLKNNLTSEENRKLYNDYKNDLGTIYDHFADGIRVRSEYEWYEHGEKPIKFFLTLS